MSDIETVEDLSDEIERVIFRDARPPVHIKGGKFAPCPNPKGCVAPECSGKFAREKE